MCVWDAFLYGCTYAFKYVNLDSIISFNSCIKLRLARPILAVGLHALEMINSQMCVGKTSEKKTSNRNNFLFGYSFFFQTQIEKKFTAVDCFILGYLWCMILSCIYCHQLVFGYLFYYYRFASLAFRYGRNGGKRVIFFLVEFRFLFIFRLFSVSTQPIHKMNCFFMGACLPVCQMCFMQISWNANVFEMEIIIKNVLFCWCINFNSFFCFIFFSFLIKWCVIIVIYPKENWSLFLFPNNGIWFLGWHSLGGYYYYHYFFL